MPKEDPYVSCAFCSIPDIKERTIIENDLVWAFPTNIPITPGHTLVAPRRHAARLEDLTEAERLASMDMAATIMKALRSAYGAEGFNCAWNQEKPAGQSVPHFHLHIVPRKNGDTGVLGYDPRSMMYRTGDREPTAQNELLRMRDTIRAAITS
jgi:histidine triad (HIT) family protein